MQRKFPKRKKEIPTPTDEHFNHKRLTIDFKVLRNCITPLKPRVSAGFGRLRNEHLLALLFNERSNAYPRTKYAFGHLHSLTNIIVTGSLPWYFLCCMDSNKYRSLE